MAALSVARRLVIRLSVRPTRQLEIRADPKCFLPLLVRYSVTADCRKSFLLFSAR